MEGSQQWINVRITLGLRKQSELAVVLYIGKFEISN